MRLKSKAPNPVSHDIVWDALIVGGGLAGLSAAIYLGRARRANLIVDAGRSLALWEPHVENYLGFPDSISGEDLLKRGREQAERFGTAFVEDNVTKLEMAPHGFFVHGKRADFKARRVLLATGLYHIPPDIPGVNECLGHSMFFCKDCDAYRTQGQRIGIIGSINDAVEYALSILPYSPYVAVLTNGERPRWDDLHDQWLREYEIPRWEEKIVEVRHTNGKVSEILLNSGEALKVDAMFTTRGDIFHNDLAQEVGAKLDPAGQVVIDDNMQTTRKGLYAAGCVTPANCQMIVAAGAGAAAAQAINRDLFEESLRNHALRRFRDRQLEENQADFRAA